MTTVIKKSGEDSALASYFSLLIKLHRLIESGKGDSDDAESIRDHMDVYWEGLSQHELELANQLSEDLYSRSLSTSKHPLGIEVYPKTVASQFSSAKESGDWLTALKLINQHASEISFDRAMLLRGMTYRDLGFPQIGLLFISSAAQASSDPEPAHIVELNTLLRYVDVDLAAERGLNLLRSGNSLSPRLRFLIVGILMEAATKALGVSRERLLEQSKDILVDLVRELGNEAGSMAARCHEMLGQSYFLLGQTKSAVDELATAIRIGPTGDGLYVQSGLMKLDSDFDSAKTDFLKAAQQGSSSIWPYYYLAFDALQSHDYERCLYLTNEALTRESDLDIQGNLHAWMAMCIASMNTSLDQITINNIRHHFRIAMTLSPASQSIGWNEEVFERALQKATIRQSWNLGRPVSAFHATNVAISKRISDLVPSS